MIPYTLRINNSKTYGVQFWDPVNFNLNTTINICVDSMDLTGVIEDFSNITLLEILSGDMVVASFTEFDGYSNIMMQGRELSGVFIDGGDLYYVVAVTLTKTNLIEKVNRISEIVNPVIDVEAMSLSDYKDYKISQIKEEVQADIFAGTDIELSSGETETFQFTLEDQSNISNLYMTILSGGGQIPSLPFHSHGNYCRQYPAADIVKIYVEMQKLITLKTTIANFTIQKVRECEDKSSVDEIYYGMEFDETTQSQIQSIYEGTLSVIDTMMESFSI